MIKLNRSALVEHGASAMYALVADIDRYPEFLPWCSRALVHETRDAYVRATIGIDFRGVRQEFTTENINSPSTSIRMKLIDGPFRRLDGEWRFQALTHEACKVELLLEYEFGNALLGKLIGPVFNHIAATLVDAFVERAETLRRAG
jgi:ribosome-associated toxin RatA of RatAB toxin-antitoxin module